MQNAVLKIYPSSKFLCCIKTSINPKTRKINYLGLYFKIINKIMQLNNCAILIYIVINSISFIDQENIILANLD